jgi:Protein of unknown function (DUF3168)
MAPRRSSTGMVQAAVYTHLAGDSSLMALAPVFDQVPQGQAYPYIEIAELIETPDNTEGQQGRQVMVTIFAWDQTPGFKLLEEILDNLLRLVDEDIIPTVAGSGWSIWSNEYVRDEATKMPDGLTRQLAVQIQVSTTRDALGE